MKITFELANEQRILVKRNGTIIGHIFSGNSSCSGMKSIQICGFQKIDPSDSDHSWYCHSFSNSKDLCLIFDEVERCSHGDCDYNSTKDRRTCRDCGQIQIKTEWINAENNGEKQNEKR